MSDWCQLNCLRYPPHCPETMCTCLTSCRALPNQENITDFKCSKRCLRYPHRDQCPKQCKCSSDPAEDNDSIDAVIIDARGHAQVRAQKPKPSIQTFYKLYNPLYPVQWTFTPTLITNYLYKKWIHLCQKPTYCFIINNNALIKLNLNSFTHCFNKINKDLTLFNLI